MNLLFYGPPGTGKSELARYIACHLDKELICKKTSDILDSFVGGTEQNIKEAFEEAESEEVSPQSLVQALREEADVKRFHSGRKHIGF